MKRRKHKHIDLTTETRAPCPHCGHANLMRHSLGSRTVTCLRADLHIRYNKFQCLACRKHCTTDMSYYAFPAWKYSRRVVRLALAIRKTGKYTLVATSDIFRRRYGIAVPGATIHEWEHMVDDA